MALKGSGNNTEKALKTNGMNEVLSFLSAKHQDVHYLQVRRNIITE
jgi:hypothetical protein